MIKWTKRVYHLIILLGIAILVIMALFSNTKQFYADSGASAREFERFYGFRELEGVEHISYDIPQFPMVGDNLAIFTTDQEIWVVKNGKPVYYELCGDGLYNKSTGSDWHFIPIQPGDGGGTIDIYTRFTYPDFFRFMEREPVLKYGQAQQLYLQTSRQFSVSRVLGVALIILGIVFIICAQTVIRVTRKAVPELDYSMLYLGMFSVFLGVFTGTQFQLTSLFMEKQTLNAAISGVPLAIMLPSFSFFVRELYRAPHHKAWDIICIISTGIATISILLQLFDILDLAQSLVLTHVAIVLSTIIAAGMAVADVRRGTATKVMRGHLAPILACFVCAIADTVCYYLGTADNDMFGRLGFLVLISYSGYTSLKNARILLVEGKESELYKRLATSDALTGLPNRTALVFGLTDAARTGHKRYGFFMMDLNDLKSCNDTMGHQAGDEYLCTCAAIIAKAFADYGTAYRIGGDEFVVVIEKPDSEKNAEHIKAMEKLESEHNGVEGAYPVGIAWDYAEYSRELDASYDDTISRADRNMYELKKDMKPHEEQIAKTSCAPNKRKGAAKK